MASAGNTGGGDVPVARKSTAVASREASMILKSHEDFAKYIEADLDKIREEDMRGARMLNCPETKRATTASSQRKSPRRSGAGFGSQKTFSARPRRDMGWVTEKRDLLAGEGHRAASRRERARNSSLVNEEEAREWDVVDVDEDWAVVSPDKSDKSDEEDEKDEEYEFV